MCAHLPAPRTVQVVGGARYRAVCGGVLGGEFSVPAYLAAVGALAAPRMENSKEE